MVIASYFLGLATGVTVGFLIGTVYAFIRMK